MSAASATNGRRWFAVVPAAGRSVRMGRPKLLLPWDDAGRRATLIERVLGIWRSLGPTAVVVTVHPDDAELAAVCRAAGAEVVQPTIPPIDMKASIGAALAHLRSTHAPADDDVWLAAPADLPELAPSVVRQLLEASSSAATPIVRPRHAGRFGHPTLFRWSCVGELESIPSDRGVDFLFERLPSLTVEAGPACLAADIDTPDDYRRLQNRHDRDDDPLRPA
jgi:molybdenum cofactor cytidylyltransferase